MTIAFQLADFAFIWDPYHEVLIMNFQLVKSLSVFYLTKMSDTDGLVWKQNLY